MLREREPIVNESVSAPSPVRGQRTQVKPNGTSVGCVEPVSSPARDRLVAAVVDTTWRSPRHLHRKDTMAESPLQESEIRARLRTLMDARLLQRVAPKRIAARLASGDHPCVGCTVPITKGDTEYEVGGPAVLLYFHRRCLELWALEAQHREGSGQRTE